MPTQDGCVPNIGPNERRRRMVFGLVWLVIGIALGVAVVLYDVPRTSRVFLFVPFWLAGIGVFQAIDKTCIRLVRRRQRNLDAGPEAVVDLAALQRMQVQAGRVHLKSLVLAGVATAVVVAIHG